MEKCKNCENLELIIKDLCYDDSFGMLTRNGLKYYMERNDFDYNYSIFIDFISMSEMNRELGYYSVNDKIKCLFENEKESLIGRWFSGDEIVILTNNLDIVKRLVNKSKYLGLNFRSFSSEIKDCPIKFCYLDNLINNILKKEI